MRREVASIRDTTCSEESSSAGLHYVLEKFAVFLGCEWKGGEWVQTTRSIIYVFQTQCRQMENECELGNEYFKLDIEDGTGGLGAPLSSRALSCIWHLEWLTTSGWSGDPTMVSQWLGRPLLI